MGVGARSTLIAVTAALVALGTSVALLLAPPVTALLAPASGACELTGLDAQRVRALAEDVRAFVTRADARPLPRTVDERPAFDEAATSHLRDVRAAIIAARWITVAALAVFAVLAAHAVSHGHQHALSLGLRAAGIALIASVGGAATIALVDFDAFFAGFHGLLFEPGTWVFPDDALLIRLFPLVFWRSMAAALGGLLLVWALALLVGAHAVRGLEHEHR